MIILGLNDGFDAGAAVIKDGKILAAINEERLSRIKLHEGYYHGWPYLSTKKVLEIAKIIPDQIDLVAVSTVVDPALPVRVLGYFKGKQPSGKAVSVKPDSFIIKRKALNYFTAQKSDSLVGHLSKLVMKPIFHLFLRKFGLGNKEVVIIDHHRVHQAAAYYTSGLKKGLVVTMDGHGDGYSATFSTYEGKDHELLYTTRSKDSIGWFYAQITHCLGFKMNRHEGKITGLAAYGDEKILKGKFDKLVFSSKDKTRTISKLGFKYDGVKKLGKIIKGYKREDVAAATQKKFERVICEIVSNVVDKTGVHDLALAGGVFGNVRLNQYLLELENVNSVFIHPHMGDGGLAVGAALVAWSSRADNPKSYKLDNVFFGDEFTNSQIEEYLKKENLKYEYHNDIEKVIAEKIQEKKIVGRYNGRMEYGPRALGNRSILADPTDKTINDWLNKRLSRTEFMPFAPSVLDKDASKLFYNYKAGEYPASFMTITFNCTEECQKAAAVVHVDNTARPQVVSEKQNKSYYEILKNYKKLTGLPLLVNTSFNMHEEPIVHSPQDAVRGFNVGSVDVLAIGNFILEK